MSETQEQVTSPQEKDSPESISQLTERVDTLSKAVESLKADRIKMEAAVNKNAELLQYWAMALQIVLDRIKLSGKELTDAIAKKAEGYFNAKRARAGKLDAASSAGLGQPAVSSGPNDGASTGSPSQPQNVPEQPEASDSDASNSPVQGA